MPFNTEYNRMIADEVDRINQNKADYMAYSNQVYMNGNKFVGANDLTKVPEGLKPKYARQRNPVNTDGGITHKNGEGYSVGIKFGSKFGEDMNRNKNAYRPRRLRSCSDSSSGSSSCSCSGSSSGSSSDSSSDEEDYTDVPELHKLLEHLADMKLDKKTHDDIVSFLDKMESAGKGLKGRGSVWGWIKDKANKVADAGKSAYKFAEEKIKPIAKIIVPLLKLHPKFAEAVNNGKNIASSIPIVGSDAKKKLEEYGLGKSAGAKRPPSKWIMHCKQFAADHQIKYGDAMKSPECRASYKKMGSGVSPAMANDPLPQSALTDVVQIGNGKSGGKMKIKYLQRIPTADGKQFLDTNQNSMIGVPARAPEFMKSTGIKFEGASLGAGVMGGPSNDPVNKGKISGEGLLDVVKTQLIKAAAVKLAKKMKQPVAAPAVAPRGGKRKEKTGSALFKQSGTYPIELKQSENLSEDMLRKTNYVPEGEENVLKAGKKPRGPNPWVAHVKKYAAENGVSYRVAMKAAKSTYKL